MQLQVHQSVRYATPAEMDDLIVSGTMTHVTHIAFETTVADLVPPPDSMTSDSPAIQATLNWLDAYFARRPPSVNPPLDMHALTPFGRTVLQEVASIPFGQTRTYGEIAHRLAQQHGAGRVSAQAVGQAVGHNPFCLIIPCHRVLGACGQLTGYNGGLANKRALLIHEAASRGPRH